MTADPSHGAADFLTLSQAAKVAGRSYSWAHDRAGDGRLDQRRFSPNGRIYVTAASLACVMDAERRQKSGEQRPKLLRNRRTHIRLVIDNTR